MDFGSRLEQGQSAQTVGFFFDQRSVDVIQILDFQLGKILVVEPNKHLVLAHVFGVAVFFEEVPQDEVAEVGIVGGPFNQPVDFQSDGVG